MSVGFGFHPEARAEFMADIDWYDGRDAGVGARFVAGVRAAIDSAAEAPDAWATWPGWNRDPIVRSKGVTGFPYRVVYFVAENGDLIVLAVAHSKRRPGYWRDRISP
ncbi:type II toxin-antitoxin system RelE/ParE family toxin [Microlunatus speluncae]|uniref:type II toxin-antitoxin system RelE/ParE family toxin n=1 Tax=Microlunatus speluncae TaxID=2594267 RepID=UPI0012665DAE|nr:type II toxin-antitoxin system RelE/ParE family toxin [Microlunatus speluncae]